MPWAVAAAVVGGAISSNASSKASKAQAQSAREAGDLSDRQYNQTREDQLAQLAQQRSDLAPYREAGYGALSQLVGGTAPGGEFNRNFSMADYQADPGMAFRVQQGEQGINRAATAAGSRYSGATLKALARFNSELGSQEYGNAFNRYKTQIGDRFNRLSGLAGTAQTAVNQSGQASQNAFGTIASAGQANAANQANSLQNAAAARASGYVGTANAINGAIGQGYNAYQQQQMLNNMQKQQNTPPPDYGSTEGYGGMGNLY